MKSFLQYVSEDIFKHYEGDLSGIAVVFPNKRASLFMNEHLMECTDRPIWSPTYLTISELFRSLSQQEVGDKIRLICELYRVYLNISKKTEEDESLDQFYSWGEVLLADFDDVDKNLANTQELFQNLSDLKRMDSLDFLSEEQKEALQDFFSKCKLDETTLQKRFESFWNILGDLYNTYNSKLKEINMLYEGALYRDVIEHLNATQFTYKQYVFIGFNVLNQVETTLFRKLKEWGMARFYWDYDEYYESMEAGHFLKENIRNFGNALPSSLFNAMKLPKQVDYITAPTENAQVRHLTTWLKDNLSNPEKETAVVLCNENMLEPVLHSLPDNVKNLNITMGFPLNNTPIFSFIQALCNLQIEGYSSQKGCYRYEEVIQVLKHPYTLMLSCNAGALAKSLTTESRFYPQASELQRDDVLKNLFPNPDTEQASLVFLDYIICQLEQIAQCWDKEKENMDSVYGPLYNEALFNAYTQINRVRKLVGDGLLIVKKKTLAGFIFQLLSRTSIPFHGEPAIGLQIMGILETRNIDFKNLIMLSVNEGMLPKSNNDASFIPYNLRKAFGLTLIEHKISVYAYYFYRLIQRAEHVTMLYNNNTEGLQKGEMSRFMLQYMIERPKNHNLIQQSLKATQSIQLPKIISVKKNKAIIEYLLHQYTGDTCGYLSPSALNTYINCPLKFYFQYVAKLGKEEEINRKIDSALFGTLFHRCAELIYIQLTDRTPDILKSDLEKLLEKNSHTIEHAIDFAIKENLFMIGTQIEDEQQRFKIIDEAAMPTLTGDQLIIRQVIIRYIRQLLKNDISLTPFKILGLEKKVRSLFTIKVNEKDVLLHIGGSIDRLDEYTNGYQRLIRVVDYKTSGSPQSASKLEDLFQPSEKRAYHILQALYYAMQVNNNNLNTNAYPLVPSLFYIQKASQTDYAPTITIGGKSKGLTIEDFEQQVGKDYRTLLKANLEEIYDINHDFTQAESKHGCAWCDFNHICKR